MAERFVDELAGIMGWQVVKDTAYGACQGYLFTVRSLGGVIYTDAWLYSFGAINPTKLNEYFAQAKSEYRLAHIPQTKLKGIELVQHFASADEVKAMIQDFSTWLTAAGARSGCANCWKMDQYGVSLVNGKPAYRCPDCGGTTVMGSDFSPPEPAGATAGPADQDEPAEEDGPEGIGGWLVLFIIGRFLGIILLFVLLINVINIINNPAMQMLVEKGAGFIPTVFILQYAISMAMEISILVLLFMKRILFRTLFVGYAVFSLVVGFGFPIMVGSIFGAAAPIDVSMIVSLFLTILWITYLFASSRVRNTFTRFINKDQVKDERDGFVMGRGPGNDAFGT